MAKRQHAVKRAEQRFSRSPAGDALSALVVQVLRLGGLLTATGDALAKPSGQTSARWQVLAAAENAPATVARIARMLGVTRQSVQRVADLLEHDGLTAYDDNPQDLRAKLVRLTPRGRSTLAAIQAAQCKWADELGAEIGELDLRRATRVLERIALTLR
jgi:DNA-binding MarR family transcriptional regulator